MISLLAALMSGYALGTFMRAGWRAYALCIPLSAVVYLLTKLLLTSFTSTGMEFPDIYMLVVVALLQAPLLMLGVYLGRRKANRNTYES